MAILEHKIIKLLADYPAKEFYGQEIAEKIKCSKASASGLLKSLSDREIIFKKVKGHMKFYQINPKNLEVKKIRINSVLEKVKPLLPRLEKFSQKIILFGSSIRGEQTHDSDIDLFILTADKSRVQQILKKINPKLRLNAIVKTPSEWSEMEVKEPEFYHEVVNGINLYHHVPRI